MWNNNLANAQKAAAAKSAQNQSEEDFMNQIKGITGEDDKQKSNENEKVKNTEIPLPQSHEACDVEKQALTDCV